MTVVRIAAQTAARIVGKTSVKTVKESIIRKDLMPDIQARSKTPALTTARGTKKLSQGDQINR